MFTYVNDIKTIRYAYPTHLEQINNDNNVYAYNYVSIGKKCIIQVE